MNALTHPTLTAVLWSALADQLAAMPPGDPAPTSPIPMALSYARALDMLDGVTDELNDALVEVGELLGGWSADGFEHDLDAHLSKIEAEMVENGCRNAVITVALHSAALAWAKEAGEIVARVKEEVA